MVEALFWPALLAYGEAALAYSSPRTTRAATWGVRIGWLAQTALLVVQAARADGFPWSSWAGSLNLFVWLVVGAYLIWGCRPRFRLLGLDGDAARRCALPRRASSAAAPTAARGRPTATCSSCSTSGSSWPRSPASRSQPRSPRCTSGRKAGSSRAHPTSSACACRRSPRSSGSRGAPCVVSLPLLTLGLAAGIVRSRQDRAGFDALEAVTLLTWAVYGVFIGLHPTGRRAAYLALGGFALVIVARLVLAGSHFT